jgi:CubicO group peptidase (beta-lactamase class C family)
MLQTVSHPAEMGLDPDRWNVALHLIRGWCESGRVPSAGLLVARDGKTLGSQLFGRQTLSSESAPIRSDAIFLIASITKPVVAMGVLMLAERGLLSLDDRVEQFIPEFGGNGKHAVSVRNLLTHTSGLPDMLPNNRELRIANAPLSEFATQACEIGLDFPPGRGTQYQSVGFLMLGEIIQRVTGQSCAQFLRQEIFLPLGMHDTALGAPGQWLVGANPVVDRIPEVRVPEDQSAESSWNWNSSYWRRLGAPWGGLLTTPADLGHFAQMMLNGGGCGDARILSRASVRAATSNQFEAMKEVPADDRRCRPWGLGWRLNWLAHSANFGDFLGPRTYGHWGATGTVLWIDPDLNAFCVLFTTQPQEPHGNYLARACNAIVAAMT